MNNELTIFENEEFGRIRSVMVNGEPYFVAKDICDILEIKNTTDAVKRLDEDEVTRFNLGGLSGEVNIVNEYGLYSLILASRKPEAKAFKRWITHEVIPSIRKHGAYMTEQRIEEIILNPDTVIKLAQELKAEREEKKKLADKIEFDKPKVTFANSVVASQRSILIRELAKLLKQNHIDIGQNRLYIWLRENGYIVKGSTEPTQKAMNLELFEVEEQVYYVKNAPRVNFTTKVTPKGQLYFINKLIKERDYARGF